MSKQPWSFPSGQQRFREKTGSGCVIFEGIDVKKNSRADDGPWPAFCRVWQPLPWPGGDLRRPDTIVVTGSRIPKPDYSYANPVTSLSAKQIEQSGITDVTQLLQQIPSLVNSLDSNDCAGSNGFIGGAGVNLLNLRNLGVDRTLVLVNGRRHISGLPGSAAVDTNTIPVDLIKDVEVETGGASAIYGADAVTGVVNFIMKDDFEGLRLRAQGGTTEKAAGRMNSSV